MKKIFKINVFIILGLSIFYVLSSNNITFALEPTSSDDQYLETLREEYDEIEQIDNERENFVLEVEEIIEEEWIEVSDNGLILLNIPEEVDMTNVTVNSFVEAVEAKNELVLEGAIILEGENEYMVGIDDVYTQQGGKNKIVPSTKKIFFVPVIVGVDIYLDSNFSSIIGYALAAYVFHSVYKAVNALKLNGKELISNFVGKIESFSPLITSLVYGVDGIMTIIAVGTGGITLAFTPILKIAIKLVINYLATKYAVSYITGGKRILAGNERGTITSIGFSANVSGVSYQ